MASCSCVLFCNYLRSVCASWPRPLCIARSRPAPGSLQKHCRRHGVLSSNYGRLCTAAGLTDSPRRRCSDDGFGFIEIFFALFVTSVLTLALLSLLAPLIGSSQHSRNSLALQSRQNELAIHVEAHLAGLNFPPEALAEHLIIRRDNGYYLNDLNSGPLLVSVENRRLLVRQGGETRYRSAAICEELGLWLAPDGAYALGLQLLLSSQAGPGTYLRLPFGSIAIPELP